jgi:hypothetical protein
VALGVDAIATDYPAKLVGIRGQVDRRMVD